jgi:hypothetical protein
VTAVRAEDEESQLCDDIGGPLFIAVRIPKVPVAEERRHITIQAVNILHIDGQREGDKGVNTGAQCGYQLSLVFQSIAFETTRGRSLMEESDDMRKMRGKVSPKRVKQR